MGDVDSVLILFKIQFLLSVASFLIIPCLAISVLELHLLVFRAFFFILIYLAYFRESDV